MKGDGLGDRVESLNRTMDHIARGPFHSERSEPFIPGGEERLIKVFPWFLGICLIVFLFSVVTSDELSLRKVIEILCLSFTVCFAFLGVPCLFMMPRGPFRTGGVVLGAFILTLVMWAVCWLFDCNYFADATLDILRAMGFDPTGLSNAVVGFFGTYAFVLFTPVAVLSVISAYINRYMPKVFLTMNEHAKTGTRGKAEKFFMVPDIIDVKRVVLEPEKGEHDIDLRNGLNITFYLFVLGLIISSYMFVNPLFLDLMSWRTMLAISLMLSMFAPALIIPWQITRGVGAKVVSDAPRKYDLRVGAKKRLMSAFMTLGAFMMMVILSVYLGHDPKEIIMPYLTYLIPLFCIALCYGMLYANNFQQQNRDVICERFEAGCEKEE